MTKRLQMILIPDPRLSAQPLAPDVRTESIELVAMMLVRLVRGERTSDETKEVHDESR
jgi:hypothetical protein